MSSEHALWKWLAGVLPAGHFVRVESEITSGIPDVYFRIHHSASGWIELKQSRYPRSRQPFKRGGLRDEQIRWIRRELERAGFVWIVAGVDRDVYFIGGHFYGEFNEWTRDDLEAFHALKIRKPLRGPQYKEVQERIYRLLTI